MAKRRNGRGQFVANRGEVWGSGVPDPILMNQLRLAFNDVRSSLSRAYQTEEVDPRRNINDECGYPGNTSELTAQNYRDMYDREPIAARVVEVLPAESWKTSPSVYEDEDSEKITAFEEGWDAVTASLRGTSWYKDEEGNPIWEALYDADVKSGITGFGLLLLGLDDGKELSEPAEGIDEKGQQKGKPKGRQLLYLTALDGSEVQINAYETDKHNPRYRQPIEYSVNLSSSSVGSIRRFAGSGKTLATERVHWTRVLHLSENNGVSRMQKVWNRLYDLRKIYASDAEAFWRQVVQKLFFETHPQLGGDVVVDDDSLKDMMENMMNGLQQWARLSGMSAKAIAPSIIDPTSHVNAQIEAICIILGVPKRIFMGSERGELSSSEDTDTWNSRLRQRQDRYLTPKAVVPLVDRLILLGVMPEPGEDGFHVKWPDLASLTEEQKANIAKVRTEAFAAYVGGRIEQLIVPMDYLTRIHDFDEEEATNMLEAVLEEEEERQQEAEEAGEQGAFWQPPQPGQPQPGQPETGQPGQPKKQPQQFPPQGQPQQKGGNPFAQNAMVLHHPGHADQSVHDPTGGGGARSSSGMTATEAAGLKAGDRIRVGRTEYEVQSVRSQTRTEPAFHPTAPPGDPRSLESKHREVKLVTVRGINSWHQETKLTFREVIKEPSWE